jgi:hypothetical protein
MNKEDLIEIVKIYQEVYKKNDKAKEKYKEIIKSELLNKYKKTLSAKAFNISTSTFYKYCKVGVPKIKYDINKMQIIKEIFYEFNQSYGRERIFMECKRRGVSISYNTIDRYMKLANLKSKIRKNNRYKDPKNKDYFAPNLIKRKFKSTRYLEKVFTDVTYIKHLSGHFYVSFALETYAKRIIGYSISKINDMNLILSTFKDVNLDKSIVYSDHGT